MNEVLYAVAFVLLAASASIGHKIELGSPLDRPRNPIPFRVATGIAGALNVAWFIYGFFPFSWWLPFAALAVHAIAGAFIIVYSMRSGVAPLIGMLCAALGLTVAVVVLLI